MVQQSWTAAAGYQLHNRATCLPCIQRNSGQDDGSCPTMHGPGNKQENHALTIKMWTKSVFSDIWFASYKYMTYIVAYTYMDHLDYQLQAHVKLHSTKKEDAWIHGASALVSYHRKYCNWDINWYQERIPLSLTNIIIWIPCMHVKYFIYIIFLYTSSPTVLAII